MSLWPHRKRGVCQLDAAPRRCTGEINIRKGQLSSRFPVIGEGRFSTMAHSQRYKRKPLQDNSFLHLQAVCVEFHRRRQTKCQFDITPQLHLDAEVGIEQVTRFKQIRPVQS